MVNLADVQAARERIADAVFHSPCAYSASLSRLTGCELYLKLENLQMTGSFKERGALNKIQLLSDAQRAAGVITASAGNHAQGVARAAQVSGIKATIVMPETTPLAKIRGTQEFAPEIVLFGSGYDAAYEKACELQALHGYAFVHAFDDPDVIAGQGTIGLELLEQVPDMDAVVVPIGGGGLISGIAIAIKAIRPDVRLIGVEAALLPAMKASVAAGRVTPLRPANSLADGITVARVGDQTLPIVQEHVETIVTVTEEAIANAIMTLLEREKTLAEGAGAVGFAALLQQAIAGVEGKKVVVLICGGNIDMTMLARIIERGLETDGRLAHVRVVAPDTADSIARIATCIAENQANILHMAQNRHVSEVELGETEVELTLETRGHQHVTEISASIRQQGFTVK